MKKNILVTGGSGNLGNATVEKLLVEGHTVIVIVSPGKSLESKRSLHIYEADLSKESVVAKVIDEIISKHQSVDAAVLTVGGFAMGTIQSTSIADIQKMLSLNFDTAYNVARLLLTHMMNRNEGRIILVGSRPALEPLTGKNSVAYSLSKTLIFKLAELINAEGSQKNVKASVIVPDIIDTPANRKDMPNADFSKWLKPEAIAGIIYEIILGKQSEPVIKLYS